MVNVAIEDKPKRPAHKRWDEKEEELLIKTYKDGIPIADIAEIHERSTRAIEARLQLLDLISYGAYTKLANLSHLPSSDKTPENNGKIWSEDDKTRVLNMHNTSPTPENLLLLAKELKRSPRSLVIQLVKLGAVVPAINPTPQPKPNKPKKLNKEKIITPMQPTKTMRVTITPEFQSGYKVIEKGENLLVLGSAGTGKSTFLKWVRKKIADSKNYVVLAPTGMAALQVGGQTVHSFFGFKPQLLSGESTWRRPRNIKVYQKLDLIIIDEISMVRADVFEAMDSFLRKYGPNRSKPFGGVQILALGDLFQLSPIVRRDEAEYFADTFGTPFFFGAEGWKSSEFNVLEFTHIFRQSDEPFINLLDRVRHGEKNPDLLNALNTRLGNAPPKGSVILAARNHTVNNINERELDKLSSTQRTFIAKTTGKVDTGAFTSPTELSLKIGARVMFTRNDTSRRWVNGTLGVVTGFDTKNVTVLTDDGHKHIVEPIKWELTKYKFDEETDTTVATVTGTFSQLPLTLAWALTIHKAQGQTLENCTIDLSDGGAFADGQLYVALSRARSLESIHLTQQITAMDIRTSTDVKDFYTALQRIW